MRETQKFREIRLLKPIVFWFERIQWARQPNDSFFWEGQAKILENWGCWNQFEPSFKWFSRFCNQIIHFSMKETQNFREIWLLKPISFGYLRIQWVLATKWYIFLGRKGENSEKLGCCNRFQMSHWVLQPNDSFFYERNAKIPRN